MCQLSYIHTQENELNKLLFLLMGSFGSTVHNDGWGIANSNGDSWKCELPMSLTTNSGEIVDGMFSEEYSPLLGHIRLASASVPVTEENAHPFRSKNNKVIFTHNGTLKPKIEKDFVVEYSVEETNTKGLVTTKKIKISDSLIFFEKFQEIFVGDKSFEDALRETMSLFYGKFAFMFYNIDTKKFHIVRGTSAELHVIYLMDSGGEDAKVVGYVINTSKELLELCTTMLSNIVQLQQGRTLYFSKIVALNANTIYEAGNLGLVKVGDIVENYAPMIPASATQPHGNFWRGESWGDETVEEIQNNTVEAKYAETILIFMKDFSLSFKDIQYMLLIGFQASTLEVTEPMIKLFCEKAIPNIRSLVPRETRKKIKALLDGTTMGSMIYSNKELNLNFPWMNNDPVALSKLVQYLQKTAEAYG